MEVEPKERFALMCCPFEPAFKRPLPVLRSGLIYRKCVSPSVHSSCSMAKKLATLFQLRPLRNLSLRAGCGRSYLATNKKEANTRLWTIAYQS